MKYAFVDGIKIEAAKGVKGICLVCGSEVIARCGEVKINHWAHKGNRNCDPWWENETEWHRSWKNNFSAEWQEIILTDEQTGEKHIADIHTIHSLVIEFQHSHIDPKERRTRENFYKNMVWVVDGTRLKKDFQQFIKGKNNFINVKKGIFRLDDPEEYLPIAWFDSLVPVIFDFKGTETIFENGDIRNNLYCLFPVKIGASVIISEITRNAFKNKIISGEWITRVHNFITELNQIKKENQDQIEIQQRQMSNVIFNKFSPLKRFGKSRRF